MTQFAARTVAEPDSERPTLIPPPPRSFVPEDTSAVDAAWPVEAPRHSIIARRGSYSREDSGTFLVTPAGTPDARFVPEYDLYEDPKALLVLVDLPGILPDALSVVLSSGAIHVKASVPRDPRRRSPLAEGEHEVTIEVPKDVDAESIDAMFRNGVLRLRVTKPGPAAHRVDIRTGAP